MDAATADAIRNRMKHLRRELRDNVQDVVESARTMTDWRVYVRANPWFFAGAAAAAGYLMVPKKVEIVRPDPQTLLKLAKKEKLVVEPKQRPQRRAGLSTLLFDMAANAIMRGAIAYVGQQLGKVSGQQVAQSREESSEEPSYASRTADSWQR